MRWTLKIDLFVTLDALGVLDSSVLDFVEYAGRSKLPVRFTRRAECTRFVCAGFVECFRHSRSARSCFTGYSKGCLRMFYCTA